MFIPKFDYLFKMLLIGDSGAGKTSLLNRFVEDSYTKGFISTIGVDFRVKTYMVDGKNVKAQIWDTAGQERFRTITQSYYRGAHGVILMFDLTKRESYENVEVWITEIRKYCPVNANIILIGNKADLLSKRSVRSSEAMQLAASIGALYAECSAKEGTNVTKAFNALSREIKKRTDAMSDSKFDFSSNEGGKVMMRKHPLRLRMKGSVGSLWSMYHSLSDSCRCGR